MKSSHHPSNPRHIAIIMDGNGRWAEKRNLPRLAGHYAGVESFRKIVKYSSDNNIQYLTAFAFSSENWQRPPEEVNHLMELILTSLKNEIQKLHQSNIRIRFIGDRERLPSELKQSITASENLTQHNTGLTLVIAANYGGHWDIVQAVKKIANLVKAQELDIAEINTSVFEKKMALGDFPSPDLFIRTGGELRISNFLIWHLAYTELYFTEKFWPDFDEAEMEKALTFYRNRERRFGHISKQVSHIASNIIETSDSA